MRTCSVTSAAPYMSAGMLGDARVQLSSSFSAMRRSRGIHQQSERRQQYLSSSNTMESNCASQRTATPLSSTRTFPWGCVVSCKLPGRWRVPYSSYTTMNNTSSVKIGQPCQHAFDLCKGGEMRTTKEKMR